MHVMIGSRLDSPAIPPPAQLVKQLSPPARAARRGTCWWRCTSARQSRSGPPGTSAISGPALPPCTLGGHAGAAADELPVAAEDRVERRAPRVGRGAGAAEIGAVARARARSRLIRIPRAGAPWARGVAAAGHRASRPAFTGTSTTSNESGPRAPQAMVVTATKEAAIRYLERDVPPGAWARMGWRSCAAAAPRRKGRFRVPAASPPRFVTRRSARCPRPRGRRTPRRRSSGARAPCPCLLACGRA